MMKDILLQFKELAEKRGYTEKVVGDHAYRNTKTRHFIRFIKATKEGYIWYYDSVKGVVEYVESSPKR